MNSRIDFTQGPQHSTLKVDKKRKKKSTNRLRKDTFSRDQPGGRNKKPSQTYAFSSRIIMMSTKRKRLIISQGPRKEGSMCTLGWSKTAGNRQINKINKHYKNEDEGNENELIAVRAAAVCRAAACRT